MKKKYLKPEIDVLTVATGDILVGSDEKDNIWEENVGDDF